MSSATPWMSRNSAVNGMTNLNGQTIGRQGLASEVSPIWNA